MIVVVDYLTAFDREIRDHSFIHKIGYREKAKPNEFRIGLLNTEIRRLLKESKLEKCMDIVNKCSLSSDW